MFDFIFFMHTCLSIAWDIAMKYCKDVGYVLGYMLMTVVFICFSDYNSMAGVIAHLIISAVMMPFITAFMFFIVLLFTSLRK